MKKNLLIATMVGIVAAILLTPLIWRIHIEKEISLLEARVEATGDEARLNVAQIREDFEERFKESQAQTKALLENEIRTINDKIAELEKKVILDNAALFWAQEELKEKVSQFQPSGTTDKK